jgi:hypothetical protein
MQKRAPARDGRKSVKDAGGHDAQLHNPVARGVQQYVQVFQKLSILGGRVGSHGCFFGMLIGKTLKTKQNVLY